jgi:hypothetical protein
LVGESMSELEDCYGSAVAVDKGRIREHRARGTSAVGSRYQTTGEYTAD